MSSSSPHGLGWGPGTMPADTGSSPGAAFGEVVLRLFARAGAQSYAAAFLGAHARAHACFAWGVISCTEPPQMNSRPSFSLAGSHHGVMDWRRRLRLLRPLRYDFTVGFSPPLTLSGADRVLLVHLLPLQQFVDGPLWLISGRLCGHSACCGRRQKNQTRKNESEASMSVISRSPPRSTPSKACSPRPARSSPCA